MRYISKRKNYPDWYFVYVPIDGKNKYIGKYSSLAAAIVARDIFLSDLGRVVMPKGISNLKNGEFEAYIHITTEKGKHHKIHVGIFNTISEAVKARLEFIENLK